MVPKGRAADAARSSRVDAAPRSCDHDGMRDVALALLGTLVAGALVWVSLTGARLVSAYVVGLD